ncbi:hypothetical protein Ddc_17470 [Ditylenchus destructor]|nr:hypothetical protein Ddc_17470 [Ditylenchus destructor]
MAINIGVKSPFKDIPQAFHYTKSRFPLQSHKQFSYKTRPKDDRFLRIKLLNVQILRTNGHRGGTFDAHDPNQLCFIARCFLAV